MRQIFYSMKAILKHKVSIVVFCVLLLVNFFTMVSMIKDDLENTREKQLQEEQIWLFTFANEINNQYIIDINGYYNDKQLSDFENYYNYRRWMINCSEEKVSMLKKGEDVSQFDLIYQLIQNMMEMNYVSDVMFGNDYAENVFKEEIVRHSDELNLSELSFNSKKLYLLPYRNDYLAKDQRDELYHTIKFTVEYYFNLLDNGLPDLSLTSPSPWSLLIKQLGNHSIFSYLLIPLAIIFSAVYIYDNRQKQSLKLLLSQATDRKKVVYTYGLSLLITFVLIVIVSLLIPMILLGLKSGWQGFNFPILVDVEGLQSFTMFEHLDVLHTFNLSTYAGSKYMPHISSDDFIPQVLEFMKLWQVLLITGGLAIFKFACAIAVGMMCILCPKKNWQSFTLLAGFLLFYLVSQNSSGLLSAFNVFDIRSSLLVVEGCTHITTLHAFSICVVSLLVIMGITIILFNNRDYQE